MAARIDKQATRAHVQRTMGSRVRSKYANENAGIPVTS